MSKISGRTANVIKIKCAKRIRKPAKTPRRKLSKAEKEAVLAAIRCALSLEGGA